ncbi:hypothetical protein C8K61_11587 [Pseudomonas sp. GV071]|jgi:hypothetical protein|nr:hypothetical protein C8K61_11587 [Pseudomonas sp. GV071]
MRTERFGRRSFGARSTPYKSNSAPYAVISPCKSSSIV